LQNILFSIWHALENVLYFKCKQAENTGDRKMFDEDMREDDRDAEHDYYSAMARGQFHQVTMRVTMQQQDMRVTMQGTVDVPGSNHETADLEDFVQDVLDNGEAVDWEPAEAQNFMEDIIEHGEVVDWEEL
jgi:hypothetical protein